MGKKELFENKILSFVLRKLNGFPVDRQKGSDLKSIRTASNILKDGNILGIFPEGTRVKSIDINNMKDGVGFLAIRGDSPIYVCQIKGKYGFRSKIEFIYKKIIDYKDYQGKTREITEKITEDIFNGIYY